MTEKWPFHDESTGFLIHENLFYGIGDSGSMAAWEKPTREEAIEEVKRVYEMTDAQIGTSGKDLGEYAVTVLNGREYVEELKERGILGEIGHWNGQ